MAIQTRLEDMVIGDKIYSGFLSNYDGSIGTGQLDPNSHFRNLGYIPEHTGNPNSFSTNYSIYFNFIYVGDDFKGRMILVADRNVTHTISWDQLNTMGYATKDGVEITSLGLDPAQWKTNIRLLTGGTSDATTANSEWDKYIVNGPVGNDNATWNWGSLFSITSTTSTSGGSNTRVARGRDEVNTFYGSLTTDVASATFGFRPVLVAESLVQPIQNKFLIQDGDEVKTYLNNQWTVVGLTPVSQTMFEQGVEDVSVFISVIGELDNPELLCWTDEAEPTREVTMVLPERWSAIGESIPDEATFLEQGMDNFHIPEVAWEMLEGDFDVITYSDNLIQQVYASAQMIPFPQVVESETIFSEIANLMIDVAGENTRFAFSDDNKQTWKVYSDGWQNVDKESISTSGMISSSVNALQEEQWKELNNTISILYYIEEDSMVNTIKITNPAYSTSTPTLDSIKVLYEELTIEGRLKDLERINVINMAKLQFKTNALMQSSKYKLHDLVVDTFEEDSMKIIDASGSGVATLSNQLLSSPQTLGQGIMSELNLSDFLIIKGVEIK